MGNDRILLAERGNSFGTGTWLSTSADWRSCARRPTLWCSTPPVTCSCRGSRANQTGGGPKPLSHSPAGAACGVDGLFLEVREEPSRALSDGANTLRPDLLPRLLGQAAVIHQLVAS